ncbi:MAG: hypothetical protein JJV97_02670 [SAR324 cluster bacterium]|nr:hypothetical protein [SAR324 cluster bacterium]
MNKAALIIFIPVLLVACSSARTGELGGEDVLNAMNDGTSSFYEKDYENSLKHFHVAAEMINQIWAHTDDAKKAGSLWYNEQTKNFKGEPYERMMVFYYLGLIYLINEDYGNAQASFKQALLQKAINSNLDRDNRVEFKLGVLLAGLSLHYLGSKGAANNLFNEYTINRDLPFDKDKIPNTILIIETGFGPRKEVNNQQTNVVYVAQEQYQPGMSFSIGEIIKSGDDILTEVMYDHAMDRGIREADRYNTSKRSTKHFTNDIGNTLIDVGARTDDNDAGSIFIMAGLISKIISENILYQADIRQWENLPGSIHTAFLLLEEGDYHLKITDEQTLALLGNIELTISDANKLNVVWLTTTKR